MCWRAREEMPRYNSGVPFARLPRPTSAEPASIALRTRAAICAPSIGERLSSVSKGRPADAATAAGDDARLFQARLAPPFAFALSDTRASVRRIEARRA